MERVSQSLVLTQPVWCLGLWCPETFTYVFAVGSGTREIYLKVQVLSAGQRLHGDVSIFVNPCKQTGVKSYPRNSYQLVLLL